MCTLTEKWSDFLKNMNQKTDHTMLWRIINGIDDIAKRTAKNEAITLNGISFSSSKPLSAKFNSSKLGRHSASCETRLVTRETKRKPMEVVETFTADVVTSAIKSCRNSSVIAGESQITQSSNMRDLDVIFDQFLNLCFIGRLYSENSAKEKTTRNT